MGIVFDAVYLILLLFYAPGFFFRRRRRPGFAQRCGIFPAALKKRLAEPGPVIWVHAVSVGEIKAAAPLLEQLRRLYPRKRLVISTITPTGNAVARQISAKQDTVIYFPFDLGFIVRRVLSFIRPEAVIVMETELWPNFIREAAKRRIPVAVVNGRISGAAYRRYRCAAPLFYGVLKRIALFCMQTQEDARRVIRLGAGPAAVRVTGNMKFDRAKVSAPQPAPHLNLERGELLLAAGSTHAPEEEIITRVFIRLKKRYPRLRLLLAPRHPQRSREVGRMLEQYRLKPALLSGLSAKEEVPDAAAVFILDIMGVLAQVYAFADVVIIGGSLVRRGGQNPIEAAVWGRPVIFGKYMFNFADVAKMFLDAGAAISARNEAELFSACEGLLSENDRRRRMGENARRLVESNQGAAAAAADLLENTVFCPAKK